MEVIKTDRGFFMIKKMPGDGHCLFSALVHQQYNTIPGTKDHQEKVMELRKRVVAHIRANISEFWESLVDSAEARTIDGNIEERRVWEFLKRLESTNEWGGEESIAAAACILRKQILVLQENGPTIKFNEADAAHGVVKIAYRNTWRNRENILRNHYDSVIQRIIINADKIRKPLDTRDTSELRTPIPRMIVTHATGNVDMSQLTSGSLAGSQHEPGVIEDDGKFKFACWNARGCSDEEKRDLMDDHFFKCMFRIVAVQETRMAQCTTETKNYIWLNVNTEIRTKQRIGGGTAILVARCIYKENRFRKISDNMCSYLYEINKTKTLIISAYARTAIQEENEEFANIRSHLLNLRHQSRENVIICGDLNAQIGTKDLAEEDKAIVGRNLLHDFCNENGFALKNMMHAFQMKNYLTFSESPSVRVTWANNKSQSQLDHIVMTRMPNLKVPRIRAYFHPILKSDHKIVTCILSPKETKVTRKTSPHDPEKSQKRIKLNIEGLRRNKTTREKFQESVNQKMGNEERVKLMDIDEKWDSLKASILNAAKETLRMPESPPTPRRVEAAQRYFLAQQRKMQDRDNPLFKKQAKEARKEKQKAYEQHFADKVNTFLAEIENENQLSKMTKIFRFIKNYKKIKNTKKRTYISIQKWSEKLQENSVAEQNPQTIIEDDNRDAGDEPTTEEILRIIMSTRNNSAPGQDNVYSEFFKYGSLELIEKLTEIIKEVFRTNEVPKEWQTTLQVPIPKVTYPKDTSDYRCITLCSSAYKIYARILLDRLASQVDEIPGYQMAFQHKRSATDQIFVMRRILDERWRKGQQTILVSLDLKQAFDRLDTSKASSILVDLGASKALVNRIIKACLCESTSLQWFGQRTTTIKKKRGAKQGCPFSPQLFILMLHHALQSVSEFIPELKLEHISNIKMPCILGYADDLLCMFEKIEEVDRVISVLEPMLASIGLEINTKKTKVLFRDPRDTNNTRPDTTGKFGRYELPVVSMFRYLGAYVTSSLTRGATTSERIKKAYKAFHHLCSFAKQHKLSWYTLKKLYHGLVVPVATYSMEVATIVKRNRNAFRRMEQEMLTTLRNLSKEPEPEDPSENEEEQSPKQTEGESTRTTEQQTTNKTGHIARDVLGGHTINNKIRIARLNFYGHILRSDSNGTLKTALKYRIPVQKKIGRPAYTWKTCLRQDVERSGIPLEEWQDLATDKTKIKKATKDLYNVMVESELETNSDSDRDSEGDDLIPSASSDSDISINVEQI